MTKQCVLGLMILFGLTPGGVAVVIVESGEAACAIVTPDQPTEAETVAADDLRAYISRITGAQLEIVRELDAISQSRILIGNTRAAKQALADELTHEKLGQDGYILRTVGDDLIVAGVSSEYLHYRHGTAHGTSHAVFGLLEHFGCRFFAMHEDGEHIPQRSTLSVAHLDVVSRPDFVMRKLAFSGGTKALMSSDLFARYQAWCRKNRLGGIHMPTMHNYSNYYFSPVPREQKEQLFEEHPEYFALVTDDDGKQKRMLDRQLCLSHPDVLERTIAAGRAYLNGPKRVPGYSLSPNDRTGWCECDACRAWDDPDPDVGLARRVLHFNNLVAEALADEFPDRRLPYYAEYGIMPGPPVRRDGTIVLRAHPNVLIGFVNHFCLVHAPLDATCPDNVEMRWRMDAWKRVGHDFDVYDWYMMTSVLPLPVNEVIGPRIQYYRDHGATIYQAELIGHSPDNTLSMYLAAKLIWDTDQNPDALLDEFYTLYFREAADPMRSYYQALNRFARDAPYRHGYRVRPLRPRFFRETRGNIGAFLNLQRAETLNGLMVRAEQEAKHPIVQRRVRRERLALDACRMQVRVMALVDQRLAEPNDANREELAEAFEDLKRHMDQIGDILIQDRKRHASWRSYVEGALDPELKVQSQHEPEPLGGEN